MENKIKVSEILRYCPKGTKLYSTVFGELKLQDVLDGGVIETSSLCGTIEHFFEEGFYSENGECVLFPSKDQRDWSQFRIPVKRGDIMMKADGTAPFIASGEYDLGTSPKYICGVDDTDHFNIGTYGCISKFYIPASEEAKKKLFDKMAKAGYKWNANTLELEKIEPKFKEGDVLIDKNNTLFLSTGVIIDDTIQVYCLFDDGTFVDCGVSISSLKLASVTDRNKLFSAIIKGGYKYDKEQRRLVKQLFKPFDKVLVRDGVDEQWRINIFSHHQEKGGFPYVCMSGVYRDCIPYNEHTAHLLCTTDPYTEGGSE